MLLHTTKFDGSLHYRFEVEVLLRRDDLLVVYSGRGCVLESYRWPRKVATEPTLGILRPGLYHNVWVKWGEDGSPKHHYVNIATPATWADGTIRYVDLDLDLILPADRGGVILDDADEFERHRARWAYPAELVARCLDEVVAVAAAMERREGVFAREVFDWRPGDPLPAFEDVQPIGR